MFYLNRYFLKNAVDTISLFDRVNAVLPEILALELHVHKFLAKNLAHSSEYIQITKGWETATRSEQERMAQIIIEKIADARKKVYGALIDEFEYPHLNINLHNRDEGSIYIITKKTLMDNKKLSGLYDASQQAIHLFSISKGTKGLKDFLLLVAHEEKHHFLNYLIKHKNQIKSPRLAREVLITARDQKTYNKMQSLAEFREIRNNHFEKLCSFFDNIIEDRKLPGHNAKYPTKIRPEKITCSKISTDKLPSYGFYAKIQEKQPALYTPTRNNFKQKQQTSIKQTATHALHHVLELKKAMGM